MKIYFVRHGSTDSLEKKISQPNEEPLNERGIDQAKELGKRFANTKIDMLISSPHERAVQTAKAINEKILVSELFAEVRKPKVAIGQPKENEDIKAIFRKIGEMYTVDPTWHYSDEENFEDLKRRGLQALEFLKIQNKENILVVSHANFIALLAGLMLFGESFSVEISLKLKNFLRLSNTGVCIFSYVDERWKLQCWNDTSHCLE